MKKKILCISTARKNSREVKNKNLIKVGGMEMMYHNIYNALKTKEINVVAATTDIKIKKIKNKKFHHIVRPKNLTHSNSSHKKTMIDCLIKIEKKLDKKFDFVILILGNSIGAETSDLKRAITIIKLNKNIDSIVSVIKLNMFNPMRAISTKKNRVFFPFFKNKNSANDKNTFGDFYFFNGSFMIFKRSCLFTKGIGPFNWLGKNIFPYMQKKTFMEVDASWQLRLINK